MKRILFVQYSSNLSGSTISGFLVATGLLKQGWAVDAVFAFDGPHVQRYAQAGCTTHILKHRNWLRGGGLVQSSRQVWAEVQAARHFEVLIRQLEPDLVYVNTIVSLAAVLAARRTDVPCIWHIREMFDDIGGEMHAPMIGGKGLVRHLLKTIPKRVIAVSQAVAENIVGSGWRAHTTLIPNAVGDAYFEAGPGKTACRRQLGLPEAGWVVGVPGSLRPVKGHAFFLKAAAEIAQRFPSCHFAITGGGRAGYRASLERLALEKGISEHVHFTGRLDEMATFYRACDVACVPSSAEPFGRTVIEALAMGTPVVGTAVGGIQETIANGETGLLVDYGDVSALVQAIEKILCNEELMLRLRHAGRRKAEVMYCKDVYQRQITTVIEGVFSRTSWVGA